MALQREPRAVLMAGLADPPQHADLTGRWVSAQLNAGHLPLDVTQVQAATLCVAGRPTCQGSSASISASVVALGRLVNTRRRYAYGSQPFAFAVSSSP